MKKQSGFTLIELMVVMAIIAILATAGLSAYTGYIKKARDTARIADISAIRDIMVGMGEIDWGPDYNTDYTSFYTKAAEIFNIIKEFNNGKHLVDPLNDKEVCLDSHSSITIPCGYYIIGCVKNNSLDSDGFGYLLGTPLESSSNAGLRTEVANSLTMYWANQVDCDPALTGDFALTRIDGTGSLYTMGVF